MWFKLCVSVSMQSCMARLFLLLVFILCWSPPFNAPPCDLSVTATKTLRPISFLRALAIKHDVTQRSLAVKRSLVKWDFKYQKWRFGDREKMRQYWRPRRKQCKLRSGKKFDNFDTWINRFYLVFTNWCIAVFLEMLHVCVLSVSILAVPTIFGVTVCFAIARIMAPSFREALRCLCELLLLISLWHDTNTSIIAVMSWVSWCMGLHCGSMLSCRSTTWIVVCLSQHDWRTWRLICLTVLVYFGPLFGKRDAPCNAKSMSLKKAKIQKATTSGVPVKSKPVDIEIIDSSVDLALQQSLEISRASLVGAPSPKSAIYDRDLASEFPFVPELLLGVLLSYYGTASLKSALETDWARKLDLWAEFQREHDFLDDPSHEVEQGMCTRYSRK